MTRPANACAMLHLLCGRIAAGRSTLTRRVAAQPATVLAQEDAWLAVLYPGAIHALPDYLQRTGRLKAMLGEHVVAMLRNGVSVVLDFRANTRGQRAWMRGLIAQSGAAHRLHLLDVPEAVRRARLQARNAAGTHPLQTDAAQFSLITRHFEPPDPREGFALQRYG